MISVTHFAAADDGFAERARVALEALAARPGYLRGTVGRSTDDAERWVLITEWHNVGSYRRALGNYEVKLHASPLLADALDLPSAFEPLIEIAPGGAAVLKQSDRS
ncbi:MAG: antibiotic biosynthesis monooxygenase [Pseudonocardiales bacterium]